MATKKQKREIALANRERRLAEERERGLMALQKDHENRDNQRRKAQREKHEKEHSWKKRESNCILCQDAFKAQRQIEKEQNQIEKEQNQIEKEQEFEALEESSSG